MIRILGVGIAPQMLYYMPDMTAGKALAATGLTPGGFEISVNGRRGTSDTPLEPGSTVALQPRAFNG